MDRMKTKTTGDCHLEHSWILIGNSKGKLWWGHRRKMTRGQPCSVDFDPNYAITREQTKGDVVGFLHTHPGMIASPSSTDYNTIRAWVNCFGKPLVCVIQGADGLRGYWFDDDESPPVECQVKRFGNLLFGTTELEDEEFFNDSDPTEGLSLEEDPSFRPIEELMPEDEKEEWREYVKQLEKGITQG